jgi:DNA-binding PadR family transcriptional regulator
MQDEATRHDRGHGRRRPHHPGHHHHEGTSQDHGGHHHHESGPPGHGGGRHSRGGDGGTGRDHFGGHRGRARRGEARHVLLDALRDGPKHGYEIIKALEERSSGRYAPSPGTVYPTMQLLEDQGLVRADQEAERRVYSLTEAGLADLEAHAEEVADFWARFAGPVTSPASQSEVAFLRDELDDLARTVWGGLREVLDRDDPETVRAVRGTLARCREEVRAVIGRRASSEPHPDGTADLL